MHKHQDLRGFRSLMAMYFRLAIVRLSTRSIVRERPGNDHAAKLGSVVHQIRQNNSFSFFLVRDLGGRYVASSKTSKLRRMASLDPRLTLIFTVLRTLISIQSAQQNCAHYYRACDLKTTAQSASENQITGDCHPPVTKMAHSTILSDFLSSKQLNTPSSPLIDAFYTSIAHLSLMFGGGALGDYIVFVLLTVFPFKIVRSLAVKFFLKADKKGWLDAYRIQPKGTMPSDADTAKVRRT